MTTSKLILACYGLIAVVVAMAGLLIYQNFSHSLTPPVVERPSIRKPTSIRISPALSRQLRVDLEKQRARNAELQSVLAKREAILKQQKAQLATQTAESQALQQEADRYLDVLIAITNESERNINANLEVVDDWSEAEAVLSEELQSTSPIVPATKDQLEAALVAAEWEIAELMTARDTSIMEASIAQQQLSALRQSILNGGEMAIPLLINMLGQTDPELRQWAASTLGQVGADSGIAMDALLVAADDQDDNVRNTARTAIAALTGS